MTDCVAREDSDTLGARARKCVQSEVYTTHQLSHSSQVGFMLPREYNPVNLHLLRP